MTMLMIIGVGLAVVIAVLMWLLWDWVEIFCEDILPKM